MSLLAAPIIKNSHIYAWIYIIYLKKPSRPNLKGFQYQAWSSVKRSEKYLSNKTNFSIFLQINCSKFSLKLC